MPSVSDSVKLWTHGRDRDPGLRQLLHITLTWICTEAVFITLHGHLLKQCSIWRSHMISVHKLNV